MPRAKSSRTPTGKKAPSPSEDHRRSASHGGLRYVSDDDPGLSRKRWGRGFSYFDEHGERISDEKTLTRIKELVIPPAWEDVWICTSPRGHLQATGRDEKGRKQYLYHEKWHEVRTETKFRRMTAFCRALPAIREHVNQDLSRRELPREKVLATVVRLLETTFIRVGGDEYARRNNSFGLTTLRDRHAKISSTKVRFKFRGKSGKEHEVDLRDRRLARIVKKCQDVPGYHLFQYYDEEGKRQKIDADDVNEYLQGITGEDFTAKDFRTWAGTILATLVFLECGPCTDERTLKKNVTNAVKTVAKQLGNTPATCREYYIHPHILKGYEDDELCQEVSAYLKGGKKPPEGLEPEEAAVLAFIEGREG